MNEQERSDEPSPPELPDEDGWDATNGVGRKLVLVVGQLKGVFAMSSQRKGVGQFLKIKGYFLVVYSDLIITKPYVKFSFKRYRLQEASRFACHNHFKSWGCSQFNSICVPFFGCPCDS